MDDKTVEYYGADRAEEEILKRLLALNLVRSGQGKG
jgi:hypothetical protein